MRLGLLFLLLSTAISAFAQSIEKEFLQLQEQRKKAIAAATEPIDRRYYSSLEQLQRKAVQANDLDLAVKIKAEMNAVLRPTSGSDLTSALIDSEWTWERPGIVQQMKFLKDGKLKHESFEGTWDAVNSSSVRIKAYWGQGILTFSDDLTSYKVTSGEPAKQGVTGKRK